MTHRLLTLAACCLVLNFALPCYAGVTTDRKAGEADLQEAGPFDEDKAQVVELAADGVTLKAKLYISDFFDKMIINANADIKNTGDQAKHFHYYIAFFDADGNLLGCTAQGSFGDEGLTAGEDTMLGSCLIPLDKAELAKVRRYKAVLYVSDKPVGAE